ncbi:hypothetical protein ANO11243_056830 [Dothideomycetidae sp. 11243]|nr:hypothetical protein ANO11243_056830 [fungal sp. No.11243]
MRPISTIFPALSAVVAVQAAPHWPSLPSFQLFRRSATCETGQYLQSTAGVTYDQFSTVKDYAANGATTVTTNFQACIDFCDKQGSKCQAVVWVAAGQVNQTCYTKTSLSANPNFPTLITAYSAVKNSGATVCPGKGTNMQSSLPQKCETGQYVLATDGSVYDQVSTTKDYPAGGGAGTASVQTSMQACLDYCESLGPNKCAAVVWIFTGQSKQYCYPKTVTTSSGQMSSSLVGYSAVRSNSTNSCHGQGTNMVSLTTR